MSGSGAYRTVERALGCGFSLNDPLPTAMQTAPTNHAAGDAWYLRRILIRTPNEAELYFGNNTGSAYFSSAKMRKRSPTTHLGKVFEYQLDLCVILVRDCIIYLINITQRRSIIKLQQVKKFRGLFQLKKSTVYRNSFIWKHSDEVANRPKQKPTPPRCAWIHFDPFAPSTLQALSERLLPNIHTSGT